MSRRVELCVTFVGWLRPIAPPRRAIHTAPRRPNEARGAATETRTRRDALVRHLEAALSILRLEILHVLYTVFTSAAHTLHSTRKARRSDLRCRRAISVNNRAAFRHNPVFPVLLATLTVRLDSEFLSPRIRIAG